MNVVMINDTAHINGGAAKIAIMEACGLADRGHKVLFISAVLPVHVNLALHPNVQVLCTGGSIAKFTRTESWTE